MEYIIQVAVILTSFRLYDGQCTFPDTFNGTWITSYDGTWETNATHLLNYKAISPSGVFLDAPNLTLDFTCFIQDGTKYVLRSITEVELFAGFSRFMHTCLDIREITSSKYVYYYGTEADNAGLRFTVLNTTAEVCTQTNPDLAYFQHLALQNGSETSGQTLCPPSLFGSYFYNTCNDSNSNTTSMDVCTSRQQLIFNYTLCNTTQMFTNDGVLDCLFYDTVDSISYLTVYNRDSNTPDGSNTYLFVCLAVELSGSTVQVTAYPETCVENQTSTNISSPGQIIEFTPYFLCPFIDEESSFDWMPVIYGAAGFVLLILLIIMICCCCKRCKKCRRRKRKKKKRKKKKRDEEAPSDDEDSESSGSSESTRSSAASSRNDEHSIEQEVEKKSVDSGISEPAVTQRTESKITGEDEDGRTEKELVIDDENDTEVDDRASRPYTGERSRMSDLPPSTLPDDEKPGTSHSDHEEKSIQDEPNQKEDESINVAKNEENENIDNEESEEESDDEESDDNDNDSNNGAEIEMEKEEDEDDDGVDDDEDDDKQARGKDEDSRINAKSENDRKSGHDLDNQPKNKIKEETQSMNHIEEAIQKVPEENENDTNVEAIKAPESHVSLQDSDLEKEMTLVLKQTIATGKNGEKDTNNDERQDARVSGEEIDSTALEKDTKQVAEMEVNQKEAIEQKNTGIKEDLEKIEENVEEEEEEDDDDDEEEDEEIVDEEETDIDIDNEDERQSLAASQNENDGNEDNIQQSENQNKEQEAIKIDKDDTTTESSNRAANETSKDTQENAGPMSENQETQEDYKDIETSEQREEIIIDTNKIGKEPTNSDSKEMEIPQMPLPIKDTDRQIPEQTETDPDAEHSETESRQTEGQTENEEQDDQARSDREGMPKTQVHGKRKRKKQQREQTPEESDKQYNKVGKKKEKERQASKPLTTVLLSRKDEEKKRNKSKAGSKTQSMTKLAKSRTKKFVTKDANKGEQDNVYLEDEFDSSEEETKPAPVGRSAPFIAQYNNKKRLEHILEQQHYWSDPEADRESFGINKSMTSIPGDGSGDSASEYEEITGQDGVVYRVKRSKHVGIVDETNSEPPPSTKREKSFDSMTSVEDPESPGGHVSKNHLNHQMKEREQEMTKEQGDIQTKDTDVNVANGAKSKIKLILVKENISSKKSRRKKNGENDNDSVLGSSPVESDFGESEMDKLSERDSGLDDDGDEAVDVVLNKEQQAMIVSMLFDKEMNLRSQFVRDEDGKIIRRLDNTVIYDPHTGRFTFHKQLGKIFNVPRLKRDGKGRPIGGYVQDLFGPRESEMQQCTPSSRIKHRTSSGRSIQTPISSYSGTPSPDLKRSRGDVRNVGFVMPDDDAESWTTDQLDMHKRGRRDIGSALRRKLNKRLFRKKRQGTMNEVLPDVSLKKAWAQQDGAVKTTKDVPLGSRGLSSLNAPYSRTGTARGTPSAQRGPLGTTNSEQQQMYRQGLERDRKILEGRQDIRNKNSLGGFDLETGDEDSMSNLNEDQENNENVSNRPSFHSSHSFYTEDGRLVIREQGCPDLQESMNSKPLQRPSTLFTIVRSKEDLEGEITNEVNADNSEVDRNCKSAPSFVHQGIDPRFKKENTFHLARRDGSESQLSGIDNVKLRKLLEELYRDKKYFDEYIESKEPESEEFIHSKGLAEHGRGYLIERAEFWDKRGPMPAKPPMTDIGWKMYRQQTMLESKLNTDRSSKISSSEGKGERDVLPGVFLSQEGVDGDGSNESKA